MKFLPTAFLLLATAASTCQAQWVASDYQLDTKRAPRFFDQPKARKAGYSYADTLSGSIKGSMDMQGMQMSMSLDGEGTMSSNVKERTGGYGGTVVDLKIESIKGELKSFMMDIKCDSNDRKKSAPDCQELFEVVGQTETIELNSAGELMSITTPDGEKINMQDAPTTTTAVGKKTPMTLDGAFQLNQFAASQHMDKTAQFLQLIPDHAVKPGDQWIDDVDMKDLGTFKGTSCFKGYTDYKGSDCAVFYFEGALHLDITKLAQIAGAPTDAALPEEEADAKIFNVILWDVNDEIARWSGANITAEFDAPLDPSDPTPVHIPVDMILSLSTDITARPDGEDAPASERTSSYASTSAYESTASSSSSGGSGGWGYVKGIFFSLVVGVAAYAGFLEYKRRYGDNGFMRQSYEFSPVHHEPIMPSTPMV